MAADYNQKGGGGKQEQPDWLPGPISSLILRVSVPQWLSKSQPALFYVLLL